MRTWPLVLLLVTAASLCPAQKLADPQALVKEAVSNEVLATQKPVTFWMYRLRKEMASGTVEREMLETRDGILARSLTWNGRALTPSEQEKEDRKLQLLLTNAGERHKKLKEQQDDVDRVMRMLRALPDALLFEFDGNEPLRGRDSIRLKFKPNPLFVSVARETLIFRGTEGKLWIDAVAHRLVRIDGALTQDIYVGWGLLGHVNKGGKIFLEQTMVGENVWKMVTLNIDATGKAFVFKPLNIRQHQSGSGYKQVPSMSLAEGIDLLLKS